jgi:hypothetical protein
MYLALIVYKESLRIMAESQIFTGIRTNISRHVSWSLGGFLALTSMLLWCIDGWMIGPSAHQYSIMVQDTH